jgi:hypothetical protein
LITSNIFYIGIRLFNSVTLPAASRLDHRANTDIRNKMAVVPEVGFSLKKNSSHIEQSWLDWMELETNTKIHRNIRIGRGNYYADGYSFNNTTNVRIVYEYLGKF